MNKFCLCNLIALLFILIFLENTARGQNIYASSAAQDSLWGIDTTNWNIVTRSMPTLTGSTITGISALAYDPILHQTYGCLHLTAFPNTSILATIDLATGNCTQIGNLGAVFSSITFREDGQLFGVVGDAGGAFAEKLFLINKSNALTTMAVPLGNGDNGEVISDNVDDAKIYHWSGNNSMVFEKFTSVAPYGPTTSISTTGSAITEVSAATYLYNNNFLIANVNNELRLLDVAGQYGPVLTVSQNTLHGLVMPASFALSRIYACVNETVTWHFTGIALDTAVYDWGDGVVTRVFPAAPASHAYSASGNFTTTASLENAVSGLEVLASTVLHVNPLPGMSLHPNVDTVLCLEDTLLLTSSFGGTSRWYRNGLLIPGANTNVYVADVNGWYNMTKTNSNGCTDSTSRGVSVTFANDPPAPVITMDTTNCPTIVLQSNDPYGTSWLWTFGDGGTATGVNANHTYGAIGSYIVTVLASNLCYNTTNSATVEIDCFIALQTEKDARFHIAPNPNQGKFRLFHAGTIDLPIQLTIKTMLGTVILNDFIPAMQSNWPMELDLAIAPGLYFLLLDAGEGQSVLRILVE